MEKVAIIGLGWLGEPLAKYLQSLNFDVVGTKTTEASAQEMRSSGIEAFAFRADEQQAELPHPVKMARQVVVNIPPDRKRKDHEWYLKANRHLIAQLQSGATERVVFCSSTGSLPDLNHTVYDDEPEWPKSDYRKMLRSTEQLWLESGINTTILRLGGLVGGDRHPVKYLSGKENLPGLNPVNLVHREDVIRIIALLLKTDWETDVYNVCAPIASTRAAVYTHAALARKIKPPTFTQAYPEQWKQVSAEKFISRFGYQYRYPDPKQFG